MMKRILISLLCLFSVASFATVSSCPKASPTNSPNFCSSFKKAATCHCTSSGLPSGMCQNMKLLYNRMISMFGSLQKACAFQHDTSKQECIDDWNCYLHGGTDSKGRACNSTKRAC